MHTQIPTSPAWGTGAFDLKSAFGLQQAVMQEYGPVLRKVGATDGVVVWGGRVRNQVVQEKYTMQRVVA
jgi:hypothetical protein